MHNRLSLSLSSGVASFVSFLSSSLGNGLSSLEQFFIFPQPPGGSNVTVTHAVIPPRLVQDIQQQPIVKTLQPIEQVTKKIVEEKVITNVITHETQTTKVVDNSASVANDLLSIQGDISALKNQLNSLNTSPGNINVTNVYQSGGNNLNLRTLSSGAIELTAAQGVYINGGAVSIGANPLPGETGIVQITNNTNVVGNLKVQNSDNTSSATITPTSFTLGNANTFNLDSSGDLTVGGTLSVTGATTLGGNLAVNGGSITTTQVIANLFNAIATTLNIGGASTTLSLGASTGTATINNATIDLAGNLTFTGTAARAISGPTTGGLTVNDTTGNLTLSTTTSGTLAATSAGALDLTGNAASTWQNSGGALTIQTTSQNLTLQTVTSGTLAVTSAGILTFTGGATSTWSTTSGNLNLQSAGTLNLSTTAGNSAITLAPNGTGSVQLTSGVTTGTAAVSGLSIAANGLMSGTGEDISSSSTVLTTAGANVGSLLNVTTSGALTGFTGNLVNISMSGASAAGNTGSLLNINDAGAANLTKLLTLNSSSTSNTSSLMSLTSATTAAPANGLVRFNFNGIRTTAGNAFQIDDVSTTLATTMAINANSLTTGIGLSILNTGTVLTSAGVNTGSLLNINASGATAAFTGSLVNINFAGAAVANTGALLNINSSGAAQLTQSILATNASTGAPSNGLVRFNFTGAHTNNGFQIDDATQTGTAMAVSGSALTTGELLSVSTGAANTWTGNGTGNGLINLASSSAAGTASSSSILLNLSRSGANAQLAHTAYGIYSSVTNTNATSGTNIAGYFSASGATTANYGLLVANGNVGIGTVSPSALFSVGTTSQFQLNASGNLTTSGTIATTNNTASTTSSTGALVVTGGVGIGGALNVGSTGTFSGALTAASYTRSCPTGYVVVPGNPKFGTTDFCVMKYDASNDGSGNAVSIATNTPYVSIGQTDSETKCQAAGAHLITENEWMTIAENALFQNANWCSSDGSACNNAPGTTGKILAAGHNDNSPAQALAASTDDTQACFGTVTAGVNTTCGSAGTQKRTLTLSNGSVLWDIAGNVWERTDSWIFGSEEPTTATPGFGWREFTAITRWQALNYANPSAQGWNSTQGLGQIYSDGTSTNTTLYGFLRSGAWADGAGCGAFALLLNYAPSYTHALLGFRCAR